MFWIMPTGRSMMSCSPSAFSRAFRLSPSDLSPSRLPWTSTSPSASPFSPLSSLSFRLPPRHTHDPVRRRPDARAACFCLALGACFLGACLAGVAGASVASAANARLCRGAACGARRRARAAVRSISAVGYPMNVASQRSKGARMGDCASPFGLLPRRVCLPLSGCKASLRQPIAGKFLTTSRTHQF